MDVVDVSQQSCFGRLPIPLPVKEVKQIDDRPPVDDSALPRLDSLCSRWPMKRPPAAVSSIELLCFVPSVAKFVELGGKSLCVCHATRAERM